MKEVRLITNNLKMYKSNKFSIKAKFRQFHIKVFNILQVVLSHFSFCIHT